MATIRKRTSASGAISYQVQIRSAGVKISSRTFDRLTDAKTWVRETETAIDQGSLVSDEARRVTVGEALQRYEREITVNKKGSERESRRIRRWLRHPFALRPLAKLHGMDVAKYRDDQRSHGRAEHTIGIDLALISDLYNNARTEWGMTNLKNPVADIKRAGPSNERTRRLQDGEESRLMEALAAIHPYARPMAEFAIETAMRRSELASLTWAVVDFRDSVARLADTKNGESRDVALTPKALRILRALPQTLDRSQPVFRLSAQQMTKAFVDACKQRGIQDLRLHDLRREAVSRLFERKLTLPQVASVSGHKTWQMLRRYTQIKATDVAKELAAQDLAKLA